MVVFKEILSLRNRPNKWDDSQFSREALVWVKHLEPLGFRTGQFLVVSGEWFCDLCIQPSSFANLGIPIKGDHRF